MNEFDMLFRTGRTSPFRAAVDPSQQPQDQSIGMDNIQPPGFLEDGTTMGPIWRRFVQAGVHNGDFFVTPPVVGSDIDNVTNPLPHWNIVSGGAGTITVRSVVDTGSASGHVLRFTLASAAAGASKKIEQIVPVLSSRAQMAYVSLRATFTTSLTWGTQVNGLFEADWLEADRSTVISTAGGSSSAFNSGTVHTIVAGIENGTDAVAPVNAAYLRLRVYVINSTGGALSGSIDLADVQATWGQNIVLVSDTTLGNVPASLSKDADQTSLQSTDGAGEFQEIRLFSDGTKEVWITSNAASWIFDEATSALVFPNFQRITDSPTTAATPRVNFPDAQVNAGYGGVATFQVAGAVADASFPFTTPLNGTIAHDTTNHRQYYKRGGAWHYTAETAGFQIPAHEAAACPVCAKPLLPDDDLIGKGDRVMEDGALHALYIHLRCAGKPLDRSVADAYWEAAQ